MIPTDSGAVLSDTAAAAKPGQGARAGAVTWSRLAIALLLLIVVFARPLSQVVRLAWRDDGSSHILMVPGIAAFLAWRNRARLSEAKRSGLVPGLMLFGAGAALLLLSWNGLAPVVANEASPALTIGISGFVLATAGLLAVFLGRDALRSLAFPLLMLVFMIPMPGSWTTATEGWLARRSAEAAYLLLKLGGVPVIRQGVILAFPNLVIEVARECSGVHSTLVLLITGALLSGLFLRSGWRRAVLVALVVPLGILRNGFRIFCLVMLTLRVDPAIMQSDLHHRGGPLFFAITLLLLFGAAWLLRRGERGLQTVDQRGSASDLKEPVQ